MSPKDSQIQAVTRRDYKNRTVEEKLKFSFSTVFLFFLFSFTILLVVFSRNAGLSYEISLHVKMIQMSHSEEDTLGMLSAALCYLQLVKMSDKADNSPRSQAKKFSGQLSRVWGTLKYIAMNLDVLWHFFLYSLIPRRQHLTVRYFNLTTLCMRWCSV